ncbi:MAG: arginase family protein [Conexibacter sp.]
MSDWVAIGSPLDCSGRARGEQLGGRALREAGLLERLACEDLGDVHGPITDRVRDADTGVLALGQIRSACEAVRDAVEVALARERRPLVLGGDCSLLIGAAAGARRHFGRIGLVEVDGHVDCYTAANSPTGETAEMDVGILTGHGEASLGVLAGTAPTIRPGDAVVIGHRPVDPDGIVEAELADPRIQLINSEAVGRGDAAELGEAVAEGLHAQCGRFWLHVDVDVFDAAAMPAYTYHQPGGLDWEQVEALVGALAANPAVTGVSVADFVPPLDPDGRCAARLADLLARVL